ncbi:transposable element Tcb2 transposase [Trichonephila clavipes]|uniref:Transposable element Tcb2 transposase n=1 Tax=Trichonephila clavipes TaxID=2585209 RepID=A0A8X6VSQ6_TRICX|nr:transposable element Tcb2 transposase [Trichonephila clavipes]
MDVNARPHRTLAVEELLESEDITRMDWPACDLPPLGSTSLESYHQFWPKEPKGLVKEKTRKSSQAYSPDLNPIEHVWDALGRRIAARLHHPENIQQLKQMLIEEWALLPQEMLHQLVLSMWRRYEATIAVRGVRIPY